MKYILIILSFLFFSGCSHTVWTSKPIGQPSNNEYYTASIQPICEYSCQAFRLTITNKTSNNLELNWNKTLYIVNGQTSGGFMFEGVVYKDRNNPKSPDMIFANSTLTKTIWPNNLVDFATGQYGGWYHESMPAGENGIYLSIAVDNKEIPEKLTVFLESKVVPD